MKVLFLVPYPQGESPSQRYRFEHYLPFLKNYGIGYKLKPFLNEKGWNIIFKERFYFHKLLALTSGFIRRWITVFNIPRYDFVYVHREAAPVGPPVFEWIIAKVFRKKIIYDFDDAIWIPVTSDQNKIAKYFRWFSKVKTICRLSHTVTTGNDFLAAFAGQYCKQVIVIPTVVNTEQVHNRIKDQENGKLSIGWTGTFSTLKYLDEVVPVIDKLQKKYDFEFIVIGNRDPELQLKNYRYIQWNRENEVEDLLKFHIGIMPLKEGNLEKGKCGFKAIQYLSLGIPAVVSPVGVNTTIVDHGESGYHAATLQEWEHYLEMLLTNISMRTMAGKKGREKIIEKYSVTATLNLFVKQFEN